MSLLENIEVKPASPVARVVVNARTGTVVIGGDVRVTPAAVSHGSLTVKVQENTTTTPGQTTTHKMLTLQLQIQQTQYK